MSISQKDSGLAGKLAHRICSCIGFSAPVVVGGVDLWFEFGVLLFTVIALMWSERSYAAEADVWKHLGRSLRFVLLEFWRIEAGNALMEKFKAHKSVGVKQFIQFLVHQRSSLTVNFGT